jgi:16S rRNA (cytidine1402-2'-O)-methyltransferase
LGSRQICVGRELTKAHQEFLVGPADSDVFLSITRKGEFTIVIGPSQNEGAPGPAPSDESIAESFRAIAQSEAASGRRAVASEVARRLGLTANEVYRALERTKL